MAPLLVPFFLSFLLTVFSGEKDITPKADFVLGRKLPDVTVVDEEGKETSLSEIAGGEVFLLSFIYTKCASACPMIVEGIKKALRNKIQKGERHRRSKLESGACQRGLPEESHKGG